MRTRCPLVDRVEALCANTNAKDWFLTTKLPIVDAKGDVIGIMGFVRPYRGGRGGRCAVAAGRGIHSRAFPRAARGVRTRQDGASLRSTAQPAFSADSQYEHTEVPSAHAHPGGERRTPAACRKLAGVAPPKLALQIHAPRQGRGIFPPKRSPHARASHMKSRA